MINKRNGCNVVDFIYETTNYEMFSYAPFNREVTDTKKLEESIKAFGLLTPIKISADNEILDGQHRFEVCKKLGIPIRFYYSENGELSEIIEENSNRNNWVLVDYAKSYASSGKTEYIRLLSLFERGELPAAVTMTTAAGKLYGTANAYVERYKKGGFKFKSYENFKKFFEYCVYLKDEFRVDMNAQVVNAIYQLYVAKNFKESRLNKFFSKKTNVNVINTTRGQSAILENLVFGYNNLLKETSSDYLEYSYKGSNVNTKFMILSGELKEWAK